MRELSKTPLALNETRLKEKLEAFCTQHDIQLVILFGSTATGGIHNRSDLDIALLGRAPLDTVAMTNHLMQLAERGDVDVVDLRRSSPLLAMEVVRSGRVLYERHAGQYADFCSLAHRRYADTAKLRAAKKEAIGRFLRARGAL